MDKQGKIERHEISDGTLPCKRVKYHPIFRVSLFCLVYPYSCVTVKQTVSSFNLQLRFFVFFSATNLSCVFLNFLVAFFLLFSFFFHDYSDFHFSGFLPTIFYKNIRTKGILDFL